MSIFRNINENAGKDNKIANKIHGGGGILHKKHCTKMPPICGKFISDLWNGATERIWTR